MKKKILGILVCMLLFATVFPVVGTMDIRAETNSRNNVIENVELGSDFVNWYIHNKLQRADDRCLNPNLPYTHSGWDITEEKSYSDQTIWLTDNLTIENGGKLTFTNVTLKTFSTFPGEHHLEVRDGGEFYINLGSNITSLGDHYWESGTGNNYQNKLLIIDIDLSDIVCCPSLSFDHWYDIEDFDFGYVEASDDCGVTWNMITSYTGYQDWKHVVLSLSSYIGKRIWLRLRYITDETMYGQGWLIDNIEVTKVGFIELEEYPFLFWVREGAKFGMQDSELHECGYPGDLEQTGLFISADNVVIHNNVISHGMFGIIVTNCINGIITNNTIVYNNWSAIFLWQTSQNEITHNIVQHCAEGISLSDCNYNTIAFNDVSFNQYHGITLMFGANNNVVYHNTASFNPVNGIFLYNAPWNVIKNNTVHKNGRSGISIGNLSNTIIEGNTMTSNYIGLSAGSGWAFQNVISYNVIKSNIYGVNVWGQSNRNTITDNIIDNNDYAILVLYSNDCEVSNNIISNNGYGFYITYKWEDCPVPEESDVKGVSENNTLTGNKITSNDIGVYLENASVNTEIIYNALSENMDDGIWCNTSSGTKVNYNNIFDNAGYGLRNIDPTVTINAEYNWWGDPSGPGGVGPGIGDEVSDGVDYDNWLDHPVAPIVEITKPRKYLYIFDREIIPLGPIIIGPITVEVNATDGILGMDRVEFYVDDRLRHTDDEEPYEWLWDETIFFIHTIKVVAYDKAENTAIDDIIVFIFNR